MVADPSPKWIKSTLLALLKAATRAEKRFDRVDERLTAVEYRLTKLDDPDAGLAAKIDRVLVKLSKKDTEQVALKSSSKRHEVRIENLEIKTFGAIQR